MVFAVELGGGVAVAVTVGAALKSLLGTRFRRDMPNEGAWVQSTTSGDFTNFSTRSNITWSGSPGFTPLCGGSGELVRNPWARARNQYIW